MIRILFFIEGLSGGGAEKVLKSLVNAMNTERFEITVATLFKEKVKGELKDGINYKYCYENRNALTTALMRAEAAAGLTYKLHLKGDYDIEVAYLECGATKIMAGSKNKKAAKVAWVHCDLSKKTEDFEAFVNSTKRYYKKFDRVVCVSNDVKASFKSAYGDVPPAVTLYNCYNDSEILEKSKEPVKLSCASDIPVCVAVGRLTSQKGFDRLLKTHRRLISEGIFHKLLILGDGEDKGVLDDYVNNNDLCDTVTLLGFKENPYPYIKAADVYVCSSRCEGFSTTVVESLILGTPVVTTDCAGMREILGDSEYGLITENSEDGIFEGMKKILTEKDVYLKYKEKAALRGEEFKEKNAVLKTESFFEALI